MKEPDRSHNDEQVSRPSEPDFGDALSELTKNLQWEKMMTDGGCSREVLSLTIPTDERHKFLEMLKPVARDFALETGVLLPSVSFLEGSRRLLYWGDTYLGELEATDGSEELLRILRTNSWRFLTIKQVEARLKRLWVDRPELHRAYEDVSLRVSRTVRVLRDLLKQEYSIRNFATVMESLILCRSQYSAQSDLFEAVRGELGLVVARDASEADKAVQMVKEANYDYGRESLAEELVFEVGRGLLHMVDPREGETLTRRVRSIRRSLVREMGWVVPGVRFRDNLELNPNSFRILVRDEECFRAEVFRDRWLAIGPENKTRKLRGVHVKDPVYGMPAVWIEGQDRPICEQNGCVIFSAESIAGMGLTNVIKDNSGKLFSYGYFRDGLLKSLKKDEPSLAKVFEDSQKLSRLAKTVLSRLLEEGVSITDKVTILETLMEAEEQNAGAVALTELVRKRLAGTICAPHVQKENQLVAFVLSEELEALFLECLDKEKQVLAPDPHQKRKLRNSLKFAVESLRNMGKRELLITRPELRRPIWEFFHSNIPSLVVLSEDEISNRVEVDCLGEAALSITRPSDQKRKTKSYPRGRRTSTRFRKFRRR